MGRKMEDFSTPADERRFLQMANYAWDMGKREKTCMEDIVTGGWRNIVPLERVIEERTDPRFFWLNSGMPLNVRPPEEDSK